MNVQSGMVMKAEPARDGVNSRLMRLYERLSTVEDRLSYIEGKVGGMSNIKSPIDTMGNMAAQGCEPCTLEIIDRCWDKLDSIERITDKLWEEI